MTKMNAIPQDMEIGGDSISKEAELIAETFIEISKTKLHAADMVNCFVIALTEVSLIYAPNAGQAVANAEQIAQLFIGTVKKNVDRIEALRQRFDFQMDMETKGSA